MRLWEDELVFARGLAEAAGKVLLEYRGRSLNIQTKSSAIDLVTEADRAAEQLVVDRLRAQFPADGILAEESGQVQEGERTWAIDPLDGTTNYAHGHPHFCVSIGLCHGRVPCLGVVRDPLRGETFYGARGLGAWLVDDRGLETRLSVTATEDLQKALVGTGFAYDRRTGDRTHIDEFIRVLRRARGIRRCGSAALDLAYLAAGRLDGFWEYGLSPWDTTAGAVLVHESGGVTSQVDGEAWQPWSSSMVSAGPALLNPLVAALRP